MSYKKTAKDIAFDKERAKLKRQISERNQTIAEKNHQITRLESIIEEKNEELARKDEWIERLCDCVHMTKDEVRAMMENEREKAENSKKIAGLLGFAAGMRNYF